MLYKLLTEGPGVRKNEDKKMLKKYDFLAYLTPRLPMSVHKKCQSIRSSRCPALGNIYTMSCIII